MSKENVNLKHVIFAHLESEVIITVLKQASHKFF